MNDKKQEGESIVLGGGCFWCLEAIFNQVEGVLSVISGYAGGDVENPTYDKVSHGSTGHAETVKILFDPLVISLEDILRIFFSIHNPTTLNRQGADTGTQYRSIILFSDERQHEIADKIMREIATENIHEGMLVTELKKIEHFYPAEQYHQHYFEKNPESAYCQLVVAPKVVKFREKYRRFLNKGDRVSIV